MSKLFIVAFLLVPVLLKRYFWHYVPSTGIDPSVERVPVNSGDSVSPVLDGAVQYPGSRGGSVLADCTPVDVDDSRPTLCLYGGRHDWFDTTQLWTYDIETATWSFRLTDVDDTCQVRNYCRSPYIENSNRVFPGARSGFSFLRLADNRVRLFSGYGYAVNSTSRGNLGDSWDLSVGVWEWSYVGIPGTSQSERWHDYHDQFGEPQFPASRYRPAVWVIDGSDLIVYGGEGDWTWDVYQYDLTWRYFDSNHSWCHLNATNPHGDDYAMSTWKSYDETRLYAFGGARHYARIRTYFVNLNKWTYFRYDEDTPVLPEPDRDPELGPIPVGHPGGSESRHVFFPSPRIFATRRKRGLVYLIGGMGYVSSEDQDGNTRLAEMWSFDPQGHYGQEWELHQLTDGNAEIAERDGSWEEGIAYPAGRNGAGIAYVESVRRAFYYGGFIEDPAGGGGYAIASDMWSLEFVCVGAECTGRAGLVAGFMTSAAIGVGVAVVVLVVIISFYCCCFRQSDTPLFVYKDEDDEGSISSSSKGSRRSSRRGSIGGVPLRKSNSRLSFHEALEEEKRIAQKSVANLKINQDLFQIPYEEVDLERQLGAGGSDSIVYEAVWKGRSVCFKVYKTLMLNASDHNYTTFEQELEVISGLHHPAIVRFWGCCLSPPRVGIVMEYCSNGEIGRYISAKERDGDAVPLSERFRLLQETADGMEFLHSRAVIHRDLKCANILVSDDLHAKIIDFGLSRSVSQMNSNLTRKIGTLYYMSPEMVLGTPYNEKTDVYSYAIVAFEVAENNFRPFGTTPTEMVPIQVANDEAFRPSFTDSEAPKWFQNLLKGCWAADPDDRPSFEAIMKIYADNGVGVVSQASTKRQSVPRKRYGRGSKKGFGSARPRVPKPEPEKPNLDSEAETGTEGKGEGKPDAEVTVEVEKMTAKGAEEEEEEEEWDEEEEEEWDSEEEGEWEEEEEGEG